LYELVRNLYEGVFADFEKARVLIENLPACEAKSCLADRWRAWKETIDMKRGERESRALVVETSRVGPLG